MDPDSETKKFIIQRETGKGSTNSSSLGAAGSRMEWGKLYF